MTTITFIVITITLIALGAMVLLRVQRSGKLLPWQKVLFTAFLAVTFLFLAWLAAMVLLVGPSLRNM